MSGVVRWFKRIPGYWWAVKTTYKNLGNLNKGPQWVALKGLQDEADGVQRLVDRMVDRSKVEVSKAHAEAFKHLNTNIDENVQPEKWARVAEAATKAAEAEAAAMSAAAAASPADPEEQAATARALKAAFEEASNVSEDEARAALAALSAETGSVLPKDGDEDGGALFREKAPPARQ